MNALLPNISISMPAVVRRLFQWSLLIAGVSLLVGVILFHIFEGLEHLSTRVDSFLMNVYFSALYTTTMLASVRGTAYGLQRSVPLRSKFAVVVHVSALSLAAVLSYGLATMLCWTLHPNVFGMNWSVLAVTAPIAFLVTLVWSAFSYTRAFYQRLREAEATTYEARLQALRAQINPHFLFNAFNSIAALIRTRPDEAEAVVEDLADLFRYTLQASEDDVSTLSEEEEAARRYLAVEKARFRERLTVEFDIPESLSLVSVPSMTLQPLVENAVKHGVGETQQDCTVTVTAEASGDGLVLRVTDTGPGFENTNLDAVLQDGSGLANVRERLRLFFGDDAEMRLQKQGVELWMPLNGAEPSPAVPAIESG